VASYVAITIVITIAVAGDVTAIAIAVVASYVAIAIVITIAVAGDVTAIAIAVAVPNVAVAVSVAVVRSRNIVAVVISVSAADIAVAIAITVAICESCGRYCGCRQKRDRQQSHGFPQLFRVHRRLPAVELRGHSYSVPPVVLSPFFLLGSVFKNGRSNGPASFFSIIAQKLKFPLPLPL
jgi:hypothetical protein